MAQKEQRLDFSVRSGQTAENYSSNTGEWNGDHSDLNSMYCPWCEKWVSTIHNGQALTEKMETKWWKLGLQSLCCCIPPLLMLFMWKSNIPDQYFDCGQCKQRLAKRMHNTKKETLYFLPCGTGRVSVRGGRNEVLTKPTQHTAIKYATKMADIYTTVVLGWMDDRSLWHHDFHARVTSRSQYPGPFADAPRISEWAADLWNLNFGRNEFSEDEARLRRVDAYMIGARQTILPFMQPRPAYWQPHNSPWMRYAAEFLNKELGPGPELCEAWNEMQQGYQNRSGSELSKCYKSVEMRYTMPELMPRNPPCVSFECMCRKSQVPGYLYISDEDFYKWRFQD